MKSGGFILVATLWILAGLAVLAAYIDSTVNANVEQAIRIKRTLQEDLDRRSTEATLLYLLATNPMNYRGLLMFEQQSFTDGFTAVPQKGDGELWMDGTPYQGLGGWRIALQDEFGLVSLNRPQAWPLEALLKWVGVSAANRTRARFRTLDYIDDDSNLTLNGAERFAYLQRRLPPPPNWIMITPVEFRRVLGFAELMTPDQWRRAKPLLTVRPPAGYNFNTMPRELVAAMLGVDAAGAEKVLQMRERGPIMYLQPLFQQTGTIVTGIEESEVLRRPSRFVRLAMWRPDRSQRLLAGIELTPFADDAPWRKDYQYWEQFPEDDTEAPARPAAALL